MAARQIQNWRVPIRRIVTLLGGLIALAGCVWFLQGIGVLPGSYMSGQTQWAINGGVAILVGVGLVVAGVRRRGGPSDG